MKRNLLVLLTGLFFLPAHLPAIDCSGLPTHFKGNEFPNGTFFSNFDNQCYTIPFAVGNGSGGEEGDLNSIYDKIYFKVDPRYQLILLGAFPNARYFGITVYDDHSAVSQNLLDANIVPLISFGLNPFQPGVPFAAGQQYAVPIDFGGTPGNEEKGCMTTGYNLDPNSLDATQRHLGMNWNIDPNFFHTYPGIPVHTVDTAKHTNPNTAGAIIIRNYLDITAPSYATEPHIIVRDVASGCAYPAAYALNTLQIVVNQASTGNSWLDQAQVQEHNQYANDYLPSQCWETSPYSRLTWWRSPEYTPGANSDTGYLYAYPPAGLPATLAAAGQVIRMRFRLPTTPPTPCTNGCSRSGNEEMRYASVSLQAQSGVTLASLADNACTQESGGYVTLIIGTGASIPAWITPVNGYTYLNLTAVSGYQQLNEFAVRNILPAATFNCAVQSIPYKFADPTTGSDSLMGLYAPAIDYPPASALPRTATPLNEPGSCDVFPIGPPADSPNCAVLLPAPVAITALTTQCGNPGCRQVIAQPHPPITIIGTGFGSLPYGLPFTGNLPYVEITDSTQNWTAGNTAAPCNVSITEWSDSSIALVPNVNQTVKCALASGDLLTIKVSNPQTMAAAKLKVQVQ